MRLESMKMYLHVLENGSLAAAARRLHMTQPAISRGIALLEEELGQKLLLRTPGQRRHIEPTPAGRIFADYAVRALEDYRRMHADLATEQAPHRPFVVGTTPGPGAVVTPILVQHFKTACPLFPFSVSTFSGTEIFHRLKTGECDIAITGQDPSEHDEPVIFERFFYDPLELICPVSFGIRGPISLRKLKSLPLVIRPATSNVMQLLLEELKRVKIALSEMNVAMQVYGNSDVLQAVALGSGVGFVTRSLLMTSRHYSNVVAVPVKRFKVSRFLCVMCRKGVSLSEGVQQFRDFALETRWREKDFPCNTLNA